jgi:hypothetical protein
LGELNALPALLEVVDLDGLVDTIPAVGIDHLRNEEDLLVETIAKHLASPLGVPALEFAGLVTHDQHGIPAGTPVFVRKTDQVTEQYAFTRLTVSLESGSVAMLTGLQPRSTRLAPTVIRVGSFLPVLLSVSPFLPPPWGAGITFALSLLNMLTDNPAESDSSASAFGKLNDQIQEVLATSAQDPLDEVSRNITQLVGLLPKNVKLADIQTLDSNVQNLREYLDGLHVDGSIAPGRHDPPTYFQGKAFDLLDAAQTTIWNRLRACDYTNFDAPLALMISSLVLRLTIQKQSIQLRALSAKTYQDQGLMESFNTDVTTWLEQIDSVEQDYWDPSKVPAIRPGDALPAAGTLSADQISSILGDGKSPAGTKAWVPLLVAWLAKTRDDRVNLIDDAVVRASPSPGSEFPSGTCERNGKSYRVIDFCWKVEWGAYVGGWTWSDRGLGTDDHNYDLHLQREYLEGCCSHYVEGDFNKAESERSANCTHVLSELDLRMKGALDNLAAMGALIKNLRDLLPPGQPEHVPTVTPLKGGGASGLDQIWSPGNVLRYRVMLQNAKGPGPAGKWSADFVVGSTVGVTVSSLVLESPAESVQIQRQVRTATQSWDQAGEPVPIATLSPDAATKVMSATYDDTHGRT